MKVGDLVVTADASRSTWGAPSPGIVLSVKREKFGKSWALVAFTIADFKGRKILKCKKNQLEVVSSGKEEIEDVQRWRLDSNSRWRQTRG